MSIKNINEFYSKLRTGGTKLTNQFQLTFSSTPVDRELLDVTMWATGAQVPGSTQNVTDLPYLGYPVKVPTNRVLTQELNLEIHCNDNMDIHNALMKWKNTISNLDIENGGNGGGDKRISNANARLDLLSSDMASIAQTYQLVGIFPTEVGVIEFSNASNVEVAKFSAKFTYQYWQHEAVKSRPVTVTFNV
jgi:hypothetical protein